MRRPLAYSEYKDSGIDWLGQIPAHWSVYSIRRRLSQADSIKIGPFGSQLKLEYMVPEGFKVYGQENVLAADFRRGERYVDEGKFSELRACEIRPGDLVITMMGSSGRCAVVPEGIEQGIMDSHLLRIRLPDCDLDPGYLCLLIDESDYVKAQTSAAGKGAIMHGLNSSIVKDVVLAVPPLAEQEAILDFLDRETAKIDALVEKKERLIELLKEKRTALITHAVTKGLAPNVPMRDSGIEWLGEIPGHWEITRGRFLGTLLASSVISENDLVEDEEGTPYAKVDDLNYVDSSLVLGATKARVRNASTRHRTILLFPKRGAAIFTNKVVIADGAYLFDSNLMGWEIGRGADAKYVACCLIARRLDDLADVSSIPQINNKHINPAQFPLPSLPEQSAIVKFLDRETAKIDGLIAKVQEAIELLKEYRTALISAAVTGKIDVREEVLSADT